MKYVGNKEENIEYRKRPGAYAIIVNKNDNKIGIVTDGTGYFYLGGGIEKGETELEALKRELIEEAGYTIKNIKKFEEVGSHIFDEDKGYLEVIANVYIAEFDEKVAEPIEKDHTVLWVTPEEYENKMFREWQRYIMKKFIEKRNSNNKDIFNIAILQLSPTDTIENNMLKGIEYCKKAKEKGADIAVFPEMWSNGYEMLFEGDLKDQDNIPQEKIDKWNSKAINNDDKFIKSYINLAKELQMAIALTYLEKTQEKPKNTVIIIDRKGNIILKYSKVHTVDSKMEAYTQPGTEFKTCELEYERGKVKLGTMICFDRDFPESARILMLQGSEIILVPNACYMSKIRLEQLKVRAYENMVGIVTVNYANLSGKSSAYSPIVRDINKHELNSEILVMDNSEDIEIVQFNMSEIREYRKRETLGDAYRKPYAYKQLIENNVQEPFIRKDARRNINCY